MRIAVDARLLQAPGTGSAVYAANLLRELVALAPEDEFVLCCGPLDAPLPLPNAANVTVASFPEARLCHDRWEQLALPTELQRLSPDVFWSPTLIVPMVKACPYVLTVYDLGFETHPEFYAPELRQYLRRWVAPSCALSEQVTVLSQFGQRELAETYAVPPVKVTVIPGAPDARFFQEQDPRARAAVRGRLGVAGPFVLFVGGLEKNKNLPRLLSAFAQARPRVDGDWKLVLAGRPGGAAAEIHSQLRSLGLQEHVVLAGFVAEGELPHLYGAADLFAFVSLYEGFGLPPLEAMACGVPVICSRTASLPEVVGDAAQLVDPTDEADIAAGLAALMQDAGLRGRLSQAGQRRAQEFSWARSAQLMWEVLQRAAGVRRASQRPHASRPVRILVSRIGARGDVLQSTPVVRALKQRWPGAELTYRTSHAHCELLDNNPYVDVVHPDDRPLVPREYDVVVNLNRAYEDAPDRAQCHRIDLYARRAGVSVSDYSLVLEPTRQERDWARAFAEAHGFREARAVVGLGLRAMSVRARCWFDERWQALADRLVEDGMHVVTFGAPHEPGLSGTQITNTMGTADMRLARALMEHCDLVVSVDTGWVHVAASAGHPIVGLFGADLPQCVLPPNGDWIALRSDLPCSPCFSSHCSDPACMAAITVDAVHHQICRKIAMLQGGHPAGREVVCV